METTANVIDRTNRTLGPCIGLQTVRGRPVVDSGCGHLPSEHVVNRVTPLSFHACRQCGCLMYVPATSEPE